MGRGCELKLHSREGGENKDYSRESSKKDAFTSSSSSPSMSRHTKDLGKRDSMGRSREEELRLVEIPIRSTSLVDDALMTREGRLAEVEGCARDNVLSLSADQHHVDEGHNSDGFRGFNASITTGRDDSHGKKGPLRVTVPRRGRPKKAKKNTSGKNQALNGVTGGKKRAGSPLNEIENNKVRRIGGADVMETEAVENKRTAETAAMRSRRGQ